MKAPAISALVPIASRPVEMSSASGTLAMISGRYSLAAGDPDTTAATTTGCGVAVGTTCRTTGGVGVIVGSSGACGAGAAGGCAGPASAGLAGTELPVFRLETTGPVFVLDGPCAGS